MFYKTAVCAAAISAFSTVSYAQQFGGELGISYAYPSEGSDLSITEYFGAIEYNFGRSFAIGADLTGYSIEDTDLSFGSSTLHFTYHVNSFSSVGVFIGRDAVVDPETSDSETGGINGIEGGFAYEQFEVEGYVAQAGITSDEQTMFGIDGLYRINDQFSAFVEYDFSNGDNSEYSRFALGGTYDISGGPELFAQVGQRSAELGGAEGDSNFIEVGATIQFGTNRGTTFDGRSFYELIPNF